MWNTRWPLLVLLGFLLVGLTAGSLACLQEPSAKTPSSTGTATPPVELTAEPSVPPPEKPPAPEPTPAVTSQSTPLDTVIKYYAAMRDHDKVSYMACLKVSDDAWPFMETVFDLIVSSDAIDEAIRKEYGDAGLETFRSQFRYRDFRPTADAVRNAVIAVDGDAATARVGGETGETTKLVKDHGNWYVIVPADTGEDNVDQRTAAATAAYIGRRMKKAADKVRGKVGKPGQTPETLAAEVKAESEKAIKVGMVWGLYYFGKEAVREALVAEVKAQRDKAIKAAMARLPYFLRKDPVKNEKNED